LHLRTAAIGAAALLAAPALATEGGNGHYIPGARNLVAGTLPPPGTYASVESGVTNATLDGLLMSGVVLTNVDTRAVVTKLSMTRSFKGGFLGARWAITVMQPIVDAEIRFDSLVLGARRRVKDSRAGLGDTTLTFGAGWDEGPNHVALQTSFMLPLGAYDLARVDIPGRDLEVLSLGKNRLGITPVVAFTHLPKSGLELSGTLGLSVSARNTATDYQSAPEFHFEGAIAQHFSPVFTAGVHVYALRQFSEDSGEGADNLRQSLGIESLKARVNGIGPVVSYGTKIGSSSLNFKGRIAHEFGARRRFEGDSFQLSVSLGF
jgi:hypothetical protein